MIGQRLAALETMPRTWVQRIWGIPDIHTRQKWIALRSHLSRLPEQIRLLDAGCGDGNWSLELAARHPGWTVVGVDKDGEAIERARRHQMALALRNVTFLKSDFLAYLPAEPFDAVLSVASAHYLAELDQTDALFTQMRKWLRPRGKLLLLVPRKDEEIPFASFLPSLPSHPVFTRKMIESLCGEHQLQVEMIRPCVGRYGTMAKQITQLPERVPLQRGLTYPIQQLLCLFDRFSNLDRASSFYVAIAQGCALEEQ